MFISSKGAACRVDYNIEHIQHLFSSKELEWKKRSSSLKLLESLPCPEDFKCPLSKELMRDPVILATGQVCFSQFSMLKQWLFSLNYSFTNTFQPLPEDILGNDLRGPIDIQKGTN